MTLDMNLTRTGLGYIGVVEDGGVEIMRFEVSSLTQTGWGIRARVTVRSKISGSRVVPGQGSYVTTETIDFLSGKSKGWFADRLGQLIPAPPGAAPIDFTLLVEQLALSVLDQEHRQPVIMDLSTVTPVPVTPHIWPYVLPEKRVTILYGAGGTGKGVLACAIAAMAQAGGTLLGNKSKQVNVLYCDWESDEGDTAHRVAAAARGIGLTVTPNVTYMSLELPLDMEIAHIAAVCVEKNIGLVILDSVSMAFGHNNSGGDPGAVAIEFFRVLRLLNTTVLAIDHISGEDQKKGRAGAAKMYGSVQKWNMARNAFELIDVSETMDGSQLLLRHRKANLGPKMPGGEVTLRVMWDNVTDKVEFRRIVNSEPEVSLPERITDALSTGPAGYKTLVDLLNADHRYDMVGEAEVRGASRALLTGGVITVDNNGVLRLVTKDDTEVKEVESESLALTDDEQVDS